MGTHCVKIKGSMAIKKVGEPSKTADVEPNLRSKLIDRVLERIDLEELSTAIADRLGEKMLASVNVGLLVTTLFDKHGEELQRGLTNAILERL